MNLVKKEREKKEEISRLEILSSYTSEIRAEQAFEKRRKRKEENDVTPRQKVRAFFLSWCFLLVIWYDSYCVLCRIALGFSRYPGDGSRAGSTVPPSSVEGQQGACCRSGVDGVRPK